MSVTSVWSPGSRISLGWLMRTQSDGRSSTSSKRLIYDPAAVLHDKRPDARHAADLERQGGIVSDARMVAGSS